MSCLCTALQSAAVARLATLGASGIPVHGPRRGDLLSSILESVAQLGIGVLVFPALARGINGNIPGPWVSAATITVRITEIPELNTTGLTRWEVAEMVAVTLNGWQPDVTEAGTCALGADFQEGEEEGIYFIDISATVPGPMMAAVLSTDLPPIVQSPQDTPLLKRGTLNLAPEATSAQITFETAFAQVPSLVLFALVIPSGGQQLLLTERAGTRTATGVTLDLSDEIPASPTGYAVSWLALL